MIMKHFQYKEFVCKCCGHLSGLAQENIEALVQYVLDPVREDYGKPIAVNSGYRCPYHNTEIGGASQSQHLKGEAVDIRAVGLVGDDLAIENLEIARSIVKNGKWDQMILEDVPNGGVEPKWIHVSWKRNGGNRKEVIKKMKGQRGYQRLRDLDWKQLE